MAKKSVKVAYIENTSGGPLSFPFHGETFVLPEGKHRADAVFAEHDHAKTPVAASPVAVASKDDERSDAKKASDAAKLSLSASQHAHDKFHSVVEEEDGKPVRVSKANLSYEVEEVEVADETAE